MSKNSTLWNAFMSGMAAGKNGKTNPWAASGAAMGMSLAKGEDWSFADTCRLGAMLGAAGAFDDDEEDDY